MSSPLVAHLMNATAADLPSLLADDVRFASPFAEYEGRDAIARLFSVMPAVFDELALVRELRGDDREVAAVLHGRIGDEPVDVIVDERYASDGRVSEAMLVTRPLAATKTAIRRMGALLETDGS
jgi:SnoaL-like protein